MQGKNITILNTRISLTLVFIVSILFCSLVYGQEIKNNHYVGTWYLDYANEAPLQAVANHCDEVYRLFIQPQGVVDNVIRIERIGDKYKLFFKDAVIIGKSPKFTETTKILSQKEWQGFIRLLNQAEFWKMPNVDNSGLIGLDGVTFILEGVSQGKYHLVSRWSPEGSFYKVCQYLDNISPSRIKLREKR